MQTFSKRRDWWEIAVGLLLLEICLWTERPNQLWFMLVTLVAIIAMIALGGRSAAHIGISEVRFRHSLVLVFFAAVFCGMLIAGAAGAGTLHPLFGQALILRHIAGYVIWAMLQQFILQSFFFVRLENVIGSARHAVWAAAVLFGLVHLPNPVLVPVTFLGALILCELFRRWRSIFALGLVHAMVGLTLAISLPDSVLRHMRVGLGYLRYAVR